MDFVVYDFCWFDEHDFYCVTDDGECILASEGHDRGLLVTPTECQVWKITIPEGEQLDPSRIFDYWPCRNGPEEYEHEPFDWTTIDGVEEGALVWTKNGLHAHRTEADTLKRIGHL